MSLRKILRQKVNKNLILNFKSKQIVPCNEINMNKYYFHIFLIHIINFKQEGSEKKQLYWKDRAILDVKKIIVIY